MRVETPLGGFGRFAIGNAFDALEKLKDNPEKDVLHILDPEEVSDKNGERASWVQEALAVFMARTGTDAEDAVSDFLADLRHFCDRSGVDYNHAQNRAQAHYEEETFQPKPC